MKSFDEKITVSKRRKPSIWKLGGLTVRELAHSVWMEIYAGSLFTHAAALSFYFLLALFPLLLFLITFLGYFAEAGTEMRNQLLVYLSQIVPASSSTLIYTTVDEIAQNADSAKLTFGLLSALWVISSGMGAVSEALNAMYGVKESRSFVKVRLIGVLLTLILSVLIISALLLLLYAGEIGEQIAQFVNQSNYYAPFWTGVQIVVVFAFLLLAFAIIYYYAPNLYEQQWYWITPGSITGVTLWILVSLLFRLYLKHFDSYSTTYGSLGAVIVLILWLYLTGFTILIGGKINAEIENVAAEAGIPGAKHHGEKVAVD